MLNIPLKKLNSGFQMPVFGLGTWQMGGRMERDLNNNDEADISAIQNAIDAGVTHIDTAEKYANGYSEVLLGQAIKKYDRSKLFLVSKVGSAHFKYDDLLRSCEQTLKRIEVDYLDLYLMHSYSKETPLQDSIRALDYLVSQGMVKNIGVSNFNTKHLIEAQTLATNKIACNQVHYNLINREPEKEGLLQYCQNNDVFLVAWRPVEKGLIVENIPAVLEAICTKYKKTPAQVAINWLISQKNVVTLSKTTTLAHLKENLGSLHWALEAEDIELLRNSYPGQKFVSEAVPLG